MKLSTVLSLVPLAAFTLGLATFSRAQSAGPTGGQLTPGHRNAGRGRQPVIEALAKCDLSRDERSKIQALVKTRNQNIKTFRTAHKGDASAIRPYVQAQQKQFMDGVKGVLTSAQWDQFQVELKKIIAAMRADRRKGVTGTPRATPPPAKP
ncbi:MAG: hypothetical protein ACYC96_10230 [Fimbriimonadaceae bacterium]